MLELEGLFEQMPWAVPALVVLGVAAFIAFAVINRIREQRRKQAFMAFAQKHGLRYRSKDRNLALQLGFLDKLTKGSNRFAYNVLEGPYRDRPVTAFDFHYETYSRDSKGRRRTTHHHLSFFVLYMVEYFPELHIYPENWLSRIGQSLGFDDIDFESHEFSQAFTVRCDDKKFAYDICHTRMMDFLLRRRDLVIEIDGNVLALGFDRRVNPEEIHQRLDQLVEIRNLFPEYLYKS